MTFDEAISIVIGTGSAAKTPDTVSYIYRTDPPSGTDAIAGLGFRLRSQGYPAQSSIVFPVYARDDGTYYSGTPTGSLSLDVESFNKIMASTWYSCSQVDAETALRKALLIDFDESLKLTAVTAGSTVTFVQGASVDLTVITTPVLEYSTSLNVWNDYTIGTPVTLPSPGSYVKFRAKTTNGNLASRAWNAVSAQGYSAKYSFHFEMTGSVSASGNALSLFYNDVTGHTTLPVSSDESTQGLNASSAMGGLFYGCTALTDITGLSIPIASLKRRCFTATFAGCTAITSAPFTIPVSSVPNSSLSDMFEGCSSLVSGPTFSGNITSVEDNGMSYMFKNCSSLKTLPATSLGTANTSVGDSIFKQMFSGCSSLETAPGLPIETPAYLMYYGMFEGCTSLQTPPAELPITLIAANSASDCYSTMFLGCTSLTRSPVIRLTQVTGSGSAPLEKMFALCTNLRTIITYGPQFVASTSRLYGCTDWVTGEPDMPFPTDGTFYCPSTVATQSTARNTSGVPVGWTVINTMPED